MPYFIYKASDPNGKIVNASLESKDAKAVASHIQEMGLVPIRITEAGKKNHRLSFEISNPLEKVWNWITTKDVMLFTQDLAALLSSGLPVDRSLSILIEVTEKQRFKTIVADLLKIVHGGGYLSDALASYPQVFSDFYTNMVKAGEAGGILEEVLNRLGIYLESTQDLKDFIKSALIYPIFLVLVGGVSLIILLTYVVPKFAIIFSDMGSTIPFSTRLLMYMSDLMRNYWWAVIGLIFIIGFAWRRYLKTETGRLKVDRFKLKLPIIGDLIGKVEVARFSRTLGTLVRSGVPILQGIELVAQILRNRAVSETMHNVHASVKEGERLAKPLSHAGVFPNLAVQMIMVGEETGRLEEMLLRVADNYEKNLKNTVKRLISLLEPAMILIMAVIVGFIVISMLMAIFSMNELPF